MRDTVVTNDRWGTGTAETHGGFYSGPDRWHPGKLIAHKWESAMTLDQVSVHILTANYTNRALKVLMGQ